MSFSINLIVTTQLGTYVHLATLSFVLTDFLFKPQIELKYKTN